MAKRQRFTKAESENVLGHIVQMLILGYHSRQIITALTKVTSRSERQLKRYLSEARDLMEHENSFQDEVLPLAQLKYVAAQAMKNEDYQLVIKATMAQHSIIKNQKGSKYEPSYPGILEADELLKALQEDERDGAP